MRQSAAALPGSPGSSGSPETNHQLLTFGGCLSSDKCGDRGIGCNTSQESYELLEFSASQLQELRHREVKYLALRHTATKWQKEDSNLVPPDTRAHYLCFLIL